MAHKKSAKKRIRTNEDSRMRNVARKTEIKTIIKRVVAAVQEGDQSKAQEIFKLAQAKIARAAGKGVFKKQTASRKISRLAAKLEAVSV